MSIAINLFHRSYTFVVLIQSFKTTGINGNPRQSPQRGGEPSEALSLAPRRRVAASRKSGAIAYGGNLRSNFSPHGAGSTIPSIKFGITLTRLSLWIQLF